MARVEKGERVVASLEVLRVNWENRRRESMGGRGRGGEGLVQSAFVSTDAREKWRCSARLRCGRVPAAFFGAKVERASEERLSAKTFATYISSA